MLVALSEVQSHLETSSEESWRNGGSPPGVVAPSMLLAAAEEPALLIRLGSYRDGMSTLRAFVPVTPIACITPISGCL